MTRNEIETALDTGNLWAAMRNGRYWKLRRNGRTQTWKRSPERFRIPVKAGLRACDSIHDWSLVGYPGDPEAHYVISETDPN